VNDGNMVGTTAGGTTGSENEAASDISTVTFWPRGLQKGAHPAHGSWATDIIVLVVAAMYDG